MTDWNLESVRRRLSPDEDGRFGDLAAAGLAIGVIGLVSVVAVALPAVQNDAKRFVWYRRLDKPRATPPDPVFGLAWPVIETAMTFAGWRLLRQSSTPRRNAALGLLALNAALIPAYQALFFTARSVTGGLVSASALVAGAWAYVVTAWPVDRPAALAGLPLAGWSSFAEYLMAEVWRRNSTAAP